MPPQVPGPQHGGAVFLPCSGDRELGRVEEYLFPGHLVGGTVAMLGSGPHTGLASGPESGVEGTPPSSTLFLGQACMGTSD